MFEEFISRENKIFDVLKEFVNAGLNFAIVGGYAVSAYKHRFSIDADIIIEKNHKDKFDEILKKKGFKKSVVKCLDHIYAPEFIRYEIKDELPVNIDLFIGGIGSRTTNASFSIEQIFKYSERKKIVGIEKEVIVLVPKREIIIVLKLHSGRLTDFRDIVALSKNLDFNLINDMIWRGKTQIVKRNIKKLLSLINKKEFIDSFKGVFIEKKYDVDIDEIKKFKQLLAK